MASFKDLSKTCSKDGCDKLSVYIPELLIFAKGFKNRNAPPLSMRVTLPLCVDCSKEIKVSDLLGEDLKQLIRAQNKVKNFEMPNFAKTKIKMIRITSLPYLLPRGLDML